MDNPELKSQRWRKLCDYVKRTTAPICWRCGGDIDLSLPGTHPLGWTGDHVQMRSKSPELTFDPANIRPAHHKCNSLRTSITHTGSASRKYG